jgi:sensor histidine kinase regulating citrate/malate metabolism
MNQTTTLAAGPMTEPESQLANNTATGTTIDTEQPGLLGKYRGLALYISSLILVIVAVLSLNLYFSAQIEQNSRIMEAASRQTTLVQQMSRQLFIITSRYQKVLPYQAEKDDLRATVQQFDTTLMAFIRHGQLAHKTSDGGQSTVNAPASYSSEAQSLLSQLQQLWQGYQEHVSPLFDQADNSQLALRVATEFVEENNDRLAQLSGQFAQQLQRQSEGNLSYMRAAQIGGIVFAIGMFFLTIFRTVRRLMENDKQLDNARKETQEILTTVREGLFLVDSELVIGGQYSREMEDIFNTPNIAGRRLNDLLAELIDPQELDVIEGFLKLLFAPHIIEDLTGNLNPLERVEVTLAQADGSLRHKHLNFEFYRVMADDEIEDILVSVRDITDQITLEQELESTRQEGERHLDLLMSVLKADRQQLGRFIHSALNSLDDINAILREPIRDRTDYREKIQRLFSRVHRLKGDAYAIKLDVFAHQAHRFENAIDELRQAEQVEGMDFLPLAIRLDTLISQAEVLKSLSEQLAGPGLATDQHNSQHHSQQGDQPNTANASVHQWQHLHTLTQQVAREQNKQVNLITSGLQETPLDDAQTRAINDICVQLIRNAITHGLETRAEREAQQKPSTGRIDIRLAQLQDGELELRLRDDGQGIDTQAIREKLVQNGSETPESVAQWPDRKLIGMIFKPGFSTAEQVDMHAGRGVGMDVIRDQIRALGGRIRIQQMRGRFCEFDILLPPPAPTETAL